MDGDLHFVAAGVVANPDDAEACFAPGVENADDVAGTDVNAQSRQQRATQADVAGTGFLKKTFAFGIDAPDGEGEIDFRACFAATIRDAVLALASSGYASPFDGFSRRYLSGCAG